MAIIHFWDMDHTVIDNDCDVSWKEFMVEKGLCGPESRENAEFFYEQYKNECLDVDRFLRFQLNEFKERTELEMRELCREHCQKLVEDKVYPQAKKMIRQQIEQGESVCLLTATNRYIAEPVAALLGITDILATELEIEKGRFTGTHSGVYCCGIGKITHLKQYLSENEGSLADSAYYGDSSNDIVILQKIGHPFAVNPSQKLKEAADKYGWTVLSFELP